MNVCLYIVFWLLYFSTISISWQFCSRKLQTSFCEKAAENYFLSILTGQPSANVKCIFMRSVKKQLDLWDMRPEKTPNNRHAFIHAILSFFFQYSKKLDCVDAWSFGRILGYESLFQLFQTRCHQTGFHTTWDVWCQCTLRMMTKNARGHLLTCILVYGSIQI